MMHDVADAQARRAIDAPVDAPLLAVTGPAASGKTETLARRYAALFARDPELTMGATIASAPTGAAAGALAGRIHEVLPPQRATAGEGARYVGATLERLAFDILEEHAALSGLSLDLEAIDPFDALDIFARAIGPLFSADWADYLGPEIDPEIPGLRAPDRFAAAVLRLIRKLRDAQIGPDEFLTVCLRGAAAFYANPPNLAAPALLFATNDEHRGSLAVDAAELERQRRRELDLAKIIAKVYRSYLDQLVAHGCLTAVDAIAEATRVLTQHPAAARGVRNRFRFAVIDDAHDLPTGEFRLLQAIFGPALSGVTVAGDPSAATRTFAGARPERVFGTAAATVTLTANYRMPAQSAALVRALPAGNGDAVPAGDAVRLHRAASQPAEAAFVADSVAALIAAGTPPGRIAVVHRSARALFAYEDALTARNVPLALQGDGALFERHDALDALAPLWCAVDPFRHDWLLRMLQLPMLRLSDAALAVLCGEPATAQTALFAFPDADAADGGRRWDRRRDVRLGANVIRGDRDDELDTQTRERLRALRERRAAWQRILRAADAAVAARAIVADAAVTLARPGETPARSRLRAAVVERTLEVVARHAARHPDDGLAGALAYCERIAREDDGPAFDDRATDAVAVASVDRMKARRFDHVFIVDVRAGSFPPYYAPDAFLFSPAYGMIPKDSVGDAVTARTAKFTWYQHHAKLRDAFAREDLRTLCAAIARADGTVTISASGRPTRGKAAPEFLNELQTRFPALRAAPEPPAAGPLPAPPPTPAAAPPQPALRSHTDAPAATLPAEHAAALLACVRCAPLRATRAALTAPAPFLRDRHGADDVRFALPLAGIVVYGNAAVVTHDERRYVLAHGDDAAAYAALAVRGAGGVERDTYLVERTGGGFDGPFSLDADLVQRIAAVLAGTEAPVCELCRAESPNR